MGPGRPQVDADSYADDTRGDNFSDAENAFAAAGTKIIA